MTARAGVAGYDDAERPFYARALRLRRLRPGGVECFLLFEGMITVGALLALAELVQWWGIFALPAAVAVMVKVNDIIAVRTAGGRRRAAARDRDRRCTLIADRPSDPGRPAAPVDGGTAVRAPSGSRRPMILPEPSPPAVVDRGGAGSGGRGTIYGAPTGRLPAARSAEGRQVGGSRADPVGSRADPVGSRADPVVGRAAIPAGREENTTLGLAHSLNVLPAGDTDSPRQRARQSAVRRYE